MSGRQREQGILLETGTNEVEFMEFGVAGERFAVNVAKICQTLVLKDQTVTVMPGTSEGFVGSTYFRGKPIGVVDLKAYLEICGNESSEERKLLLVMEFNGKTTGYVVDEIHGITRMSWKNFVPIAESSFATGDPCVVGSIKIMDRIVLVLDMEAMMEGYDSSMSISSFADQVNKEQRIDRVSIQIVYCEDSPTIQRLTLKTLRDAGFAKIMCFPSGAQGLEYIRKDNGQGIDMILSDIEMPGMDGLALCRSVREMPNMKSVPFIFFSSLINKQMQKKCKLVGGNASFAKPEIHKLVDAIEDLYIASKAH